MLHSPSTVFSPFAFGLGRRRSYIFWPRLLVIFKRMDISFKAQGHGITVGHLCGNSSVSFALCLKSSFCLSSGPKVTIGISCEHFCGRFSLFEIVTFVGIKFQAGSVSLLVVHVTISVQF